MNITAHNPELYYNGERLTGYDAVIPRIGVSITFYGLAVLRQFEMMHVYPLNESVAIGRSRDKLRSLQLLAREGIGLPVAAFAHDARQTDQILELVGGAPIVLLSDVREGSLRAAARELGVDMLLYEAGEGLRFDELAIRAGVAGILRVLRELGMTPKRHTPASRHQSSVSSSSLWVRAAAGGILRAYRTIGDSVAEGEVLGCVSDPFGEKDTEVCSRAAGLVIGRANLPVVNQGDALFHIARVASPRSAEDGVERIAEVLHSDPLLDEDEIL